MTDIKSLELLVHCCLMWPLCFTAIYLNSGFQPLGDRGSSVATSAESELKLPTFSMRFGAVVFSQAVSSLFSVGKKVDCTITMTDTDLLSLMTGKMNPQTVSVHITALTPVSWYRHQR